MNGEEGFLDYVHLAGTGCGLHAADLVGAGSDLPNIIRELVGGLQKRLVLSSIGGCPTFAVFAKVGLMRPAPTFLIFAFVDRDRL